MKIALIGCTSKKKTYACQAKELYSESLLFYYAYKYASKVCDKVYILSAKYGLLKDTDVIEPYNVTLNQKSVAVLKEWANDVFVQFQNEFDLKKSLEIVCFAGNNYRRFLLPMLVSNYPEIKVQKPLEHLGIGKQLKFLKTQLTTANCN